MQCWFIGWWSALASGLLVVTRTTKPRSTLVRTASTSSQPGLVIGTIPAGFDNGVLIELADPQNLAAPTESFVMQYPQRNGSGRLSVTTTDEWTTDRPQTDLKWGAIDGGVGTTFNVCTTAESNGGTKLVYGQSFEPLLCSRSLPRAWRFGN